jgi:NAD(P)-dependent dehydrogenase (short-subunit alcohol dehydrogenase family)
MNIYRIQVVLLTGANTGIGLETAKFLAQLNATIYISKFTVNGMRRLSHQRLFISRQRR